MDKTKIFKGFALFNFIALLIFFLLFRIGALDKCFNYDKNLTSPNGGTLTKLSKDTITQIKASLKRQRLSSSKSLVIIDNIKLDKDTSKIPIDSISLELTEEAKRLIYSSKSGIIIDSKMFKTDSLKLKPKKSKKKKDK